MWIEVESKSLVKLNGQSDWSTKEGSWNGAAAGERGWLETKGERGWLETKGDLGQSLLGRASWAESARQSLLGTIS
jgi:hypothetical protein